MLKEEGKLLANSIINGENLGCPADKKEVDDFIQVLSKIAKNISVKEGDIKNVFIIK